MSYYSVNFPPSGNYYQCKHCGKVVWRDGNKKWVKSFCVETNKYTHMTIKNGGFAYGSNQTKYGLH